MKMKITKIRKLLICVLLLGASFNSWASLMTYDVDIEFVGSGLAGVPVRIFGEVTVDTTNPVPSSWTFDIFSGSLTSLVTMDETNTTFLTTPSVVVTATSSALTIDISSGGLWGFSGSGVGRWFFREEIGFGRIGFQADVAGSLPTQNVETGNPVLILPASVQLPESNTLALIALGFFGLGLSKRKAFSKSRIAATSC